MKRRRLGQHFLKSDDAARRIVDAAGITDQDTVLEIGPGRGELTGPHLQARKKGDRSGSWTATCTCA